MTPKPTTEGSSVDVPQAPVIEPVSMQERCARVVETMAVGPWGDPHDAITTSSLMKMVARTIRDLPSEAPPPQTEDERYGDARGQLSLGAHGDLPQPPSQPVSGSVENEELEALKAWRVDVTVALQREGGAFYADVPNHIRALVAGWKQSTMLNEAILKPCIWNLDDVGGDSVYETQCGHSFYFDDENPFKFCGYCGGRMVIALTSEEAADVRRL